MPRILITGPTLAAEAEALLANHGCICEFGGEHDSPEEIAARMAAFQPDGLIVRKGKITAAAIRAANALKAISKHGVGVDNIDVAAATRRGIPVMITACANYESVAEHALALILALARRIPQQDRNVRQGIWRRTSEMGEELKGKTLGLIGFGRVARRLAELVAPLGMPIIFYDPGGGPAEAPNRALRLADLLAQSDIVSLHCPLTEDTRELIGRQQFAMMKPQAWLINTARGPVVNEGALIEALRENRIAAAGLDTFATEPPAASNPLLSMDNVILTAHVGGLSGSSFRNMGVGAAENVLAVLAGQEPDRACIVNAEVFRNAEATSV